MSELSKEDVLNLIADLAVPVGPWVFAGFGSEIQDRLAEDPRGFDEVVETWLKNVNLADLEPILLEIAGDVDIPEAFTRIRSRFEREWEFVLTTLLFEGFRLDDSGFRRVISRLEEFEAAGRVVAELYSWKEGS